MNKRRLIVVYKKSTFQMYESIIRQTHLKMRNEDIYNGIVSAHKEHLESLDIIKHKLKDISIPVLFHRRGDKKMPVIRDNDIVIALGGDGTFIFASHYVKNAIMVGINSAPDFSIGHFCRYNLFDHSLDLHSEVESIISGSTAPTNLHRLRVSINDLPVHIPVINDLLIVDSNPATTTRCIISHQGKRFYQKSSGIWLSTSMGSSAAYSSSGGGVFSQYNESGQRQFGFRVREAYRPEKGSLLQGLISEFEKFEITISMIEGYIFFDGGQKKVKIHIGDNLKIGFQENPLRAIIK